MKINLLTTFLYSFALVEIILRINLLEKIQNYFKSIAQTVYILGNERISDCYKEIAIPKYGLNIISESLLLLVNFLAISGFYVLYFVSLESVEAGSLDVNKINFKFLVDLPVQASFFAGAGIYFYFRNRKNKKKNNNEDGYSSLEKSLHYIFLGTDALRKLFFNFEDKLFGAKNKIKKPIFITGLARGGTTILLEVLYSTGKFSSLTYRNMPFPLNPGMWTRLSKFLLSSGEKKERAHKDRIMVNLDSPEEFDEVFWLTFGRESYVKADHLTNYDPSEDTLDKYSRYISRVTDNNKRYISKNNNNTLRIKSLKKKFPDCSIIVPFRDPIEHAHSLFKQHKKYLNDHNDDKFIKDYMGWLGHFEFGPGKRPFKLNGGAKGKYTDGNINYWLNYWVNVYQYLLSVEEDILFFDYDLFCQHPYDVWNSFCSEIEFDKNTDIPYLGKISPAKKYDDLVYDDLLFEKATRLYLNLRKKFLTKYSIKIDKIKNEEAYENAKISAAA